MLEDRYALAVCDCFFNIFIATFHTGDLSFVHIMRTRHAVVSGAHLSWQFVNKYDCNHTI